VVRRITPLTTAPRRDATPSNPVGRSLPCSSGSRLTPRCHLQSGPCRTTLTRSPSQYAPGKPLTRCTSRFGASARLRLSAPCGTLSRSSSSPFGVPSVCDVLPYPELSTACASRQTRSIGPREIQILSPPFSQGSPTSSAQSTTEAQQSPGRPQPPSAHRAFANATRMSLVRQ
jgi:hypothetical protein